MSNHTEAQTSMGDIIIGIGGFRASKSTGDTLKTYALGSCVALLAYDKKHKIAGLLHVALPDSKINKQRAEALPGYFADTGISALLSSINSLRGDTNGESSDTNKEVVVKLVGGANILSVKNVFNIGQRNVSAISELLKNHGLKPLAQDVGGSLSRTVSLEVNTGQVRIQSPGRGEWNL